MSNEEISVSGEKPSQQKKARQPAYARERMHFRALLAANPNYFGNLQVSPYPPVLQIQSNTTYEELGCVGFNPKSEHLEAVVYIKQPSGYGGNICTDGSPEYVRFFLSFDGGATWVDQGLTSFTVYDVPEGTAGVKRLEYAATLPVNPPNRFCIFNNTARVRAILSWNSAPPSNPNFVPVWGEVQDADIQIAPLKLIKIKDLAAATKVKLNPEFFQVLDPEKIVEAGPPKALQAVELHEMYRQQGVEVHRYALPELQQMMSLPSSELLPGAIPELFPGIELDIDDLVAKLFPTDGNTYYEELKCIGLNPNLDTLVGIIQVKKPSGYSGGQCTAGSKEYVTFWADFNGNGTFETCLGTASVTVYDIASIPAGGLYYAVELPVDLKHYRQPCSQGPKVVPIRAILSWQVAPPCANPNYVPVWGNREETLILIAPGPQIPPGVIDPSISVIGGIPTSKIHAVTGLTTPTAVFAHNNLPPDALGRPCPFGGRVNIKGPSYLGYRYHVQVRRVGEVAWTTLTKPLVVVDADGDVSVHSPDASGKFDFLPVSENIENLLGLWDTSGDDLWQIRLQIFDSADNLMPGVALHRLQLDNTGPEAELHIDTGLGDCGKFDVGTILSGDFVARDAYFGSFSLGVKPVVNPSGVGVPLPHSGTVQTAPAPGDPWTLDTTGMQPCGYIIEVAARDRAIVNSSGPGSNHHATDSAGFCLEAPEEG